MQLLVNSLTLGNGKHQYNKWTVTLLYMWVVLLLCSYGCTPAPEPKEITTPEPIPAKISQIDTAFNRVLEAQIAENLALYQCPGLAIIVMKDNEIIFDKTYGIQKNGGKDTINQNTLFRLGSVSKGFAGVIASILIHKGVIQLTDPVAKYVPELTLKAKGSDDTLRISHILTHSSGLTEHAFSNLVDQNRSLETIIQSLNSLTPRDSTGIAYAYQNAAYGIIEKVITSATGLSYAEALDKFILSPLDMCQSSCSYQEISQNANICQGHKYARKKQGFRPIAISPHYYNVASAGGVNAPISDMKKYLAAMMGYHTEDIPIEALDIAFTPYINTSYDDKYFNEWAGHIDSHYGLGWRIVRTQNYELVYHGGMVNGFRSEIAIDRKNKLGIVMLFNSTCGYSNEAVPMFYELWQSYHTATNNEFL